MLSSRNEWILVGVLIAYLAFIPSLQMVRDILATSIGKAAALAAIVYVYKYVSCSAALLLVIAYVRCSRSVREMLENPPATATTTPPPISMPPSPESAVGEAVNTMPPTSGPGAPVNTMPPNPAMSTAPMTTPTATMPPPMMPPNTSGGVQPSTSSSSSAAPL
jgi:hypothetical protein